MKKKAFLRFLFFTIWFTALLARQSGRSLASSPDATPSSEADLAAQMTGFDSLPPYKDPNSENVSYYDKGVEHYLQQNYDRAVSDLNRAINSGDQTVKAKKLLLKSYFEWIQKKFNSNDLASADRILSQAKEQFPRDERLAKIFVPSAGAKLPDTKASFGLRKTVVLPAAGAARERQKPSEQPKAAHPAPPSVSLPLVPPEHFWPWRTFLPTGAAVLAAAVYLWSRKQRRWIESQLNAERTVLQEQIASMEEALKKSEREKTQLLIDAAGRQKNIERMLSEKSRAGPTIESRVQEISRREIEERDRLRFQDQADRLGREAKAQKKLSAAQVKLEKKHILESLVRMSPEDLAGTQDHIGLRVLNLYEAAPAEAMKFLRTLAKDANPLVRLSIAPALARVAVPWSLDLMFDLALDVDSDVRRQVIKSLKDIKNTPAAFSALPEAFRRKINLFFEEEKKKAEWVI